MKRLILPLVIFLSLAGKLPAQEEFLFNYLGLRQGLSSNEVSSIQQDKKGYIWISTLGGLQRYDGNRFISLHHHDEDPHSIPNDNILWMRMDHQDRLWLCFNNNRIGYLNTQDMKFHEIPVRTDKTVLAKSEARLFVDEDGHILLLLHRAGVFTYSEEAHEFSSEYNPFSLPMGWTAVWLSQDHTHHRYWIACDSGLVKFDPANKIMSYRGHNKDQDPVVAFFSNLTYTSLPYLDRDGRFWVLTWPPRGGLTIYSYEPSTGTKKEWESEIGKSLRYVYHEIHSITEQQDGTIWIAGLNILARLNKNENRFEIISNNRPGEFSIRYDIVNHVFEDREHNVWLATNKGAFRFNPSAQMFHTIPNRRFNKDTIYAPDVSDMIQTRSGTILVSTWGSGLFPYDAAFKPIQLDYVNQGIRLGEALIWCIHEESNGDLWRGGQDGYLFITHASNHRTEKLHPDELEGGTVRQIVEDSQGNLWLGTHLGALVKWNSQTRQFSQLRHFRNTIFRLFADSDGNIWVCTSHNGVYKINPKDGSILDHYTSDGPAGKRILAPGAADIIQYNDSLLIIASDGLNVLNKNSNHIEYLVPPNGLPSSTVLCLMKDRQGYLWVATQNGLCSINMKNQAATIFNESDGIESNSFNIGSMNMLRDGRMAIGTVHDLIVFDPGEIAKSDLTPPAVEITGLALMNNWLSMDSLSRLKKLELPYDQNSLRLTFATLTYQNNFAIQYMLDDLDKNWISATSREAIYNYIPPGEYTFKIRAQNAEDQHSKITTTLVITVHPPFWRTWWFYGLLLGLLTFLLYWFDRERLKRKEALQNMRTSISGNLLEKVDHALHDINVLSEIARIKADKQPEQSKNYIAEIHHKSHHMIIAMDDMLWSIEPENDNMPKTIDRIREFADALRNRHDVSIELQTDEKVKQLRPDMNVRYELILIYKLALRLLIEELQARQTLIQLDYHKSQLQLNIFSPGVKTINKNNQLIKILEEMKSRAASIRGNLDLQSDEKGTAIILTLKI